MVKILILNGKILILGILGLKVLNHEVQGQKVLTKEYLVQMNLKHLDPEDRILMILTFIHRCQMTSQETCIQMNLDLVVEDLLTVLIQEDLQEKDLILGCHIPKTSTIGVLLDQMALTTEDEVLDLISSLLVDLNLVQG